MRKIILLIAIFLGLATGFSGAASAQQVPEGYAPAQTYGYAVKKPIIAGACHFCPWGALADVVKDAMKPYGWDIQQCLNCSGANSIRVPGNNEIPPLRTAGQVASGTPPPPYAKVDFGATSPQNLYDAYHGLGQYAADGPGHYKHLRLVARVDQPSYFVVAVKEVTGITDLRQIIERRIPVRIQSSGVEGDKVLQHYGLTSQVIASFGGTGGYAPPAPAAAAGRGAGGDAALLDAANAGRGGAAPAAGRGGRGGAPLPPNPSGRPNNVPDADVYLYSNAIMANNPESNLMYQITQGQRLVFLQLPEEVLVKLAEWPQERVIMPQAYFVGVNQDIKTVGRNGQLVYVRADAPANFAYDLAKAMNEQKALLKWKVLPFSYDPANVANTRKNAPLGDVPLHPGAARYYREVGYIK